MITTLNFRSFGRLVLSECLFFILALTIVELARAQASSQNAGTLVRASDITTSGSGCDHYQVPTRGTRLAAQKFKEEQTEWVLGNKLASNAERNATLFFDASILEYINHVEQTIVANSQLSGCFNVKIVVDPEANAYSLPGGFIYITTGMIETVQNEGQLAAVLAHETGHVTAHHLTRVDARARNFTRMALFAGPMGLFLRHYLGALFTFKLLRSIEFDADRLAIRYIVASGYNPDDFCKMLELAFPDEKTQSWLDRLFNDHPPTGARIKRLQASRSLPIAAPAERADNSQEFLGIKKRFATLMAGIGER